MKTFISEFVPNQNVSTTFLVKSKELRTKKTGGQFVLMVLSDKSGDIAAQWWDNFEETVDTFDRDDIVFCRGMVNHYRNHLQLSVHRMRRCEEREIELAHYFPSTRYDTEEMFADLLSTINGFSNPFLRDLLLNIFADAETARKFKRAPAAKTMHHPYLGGLLEHSLSLVRLCRKVGGHYDGIDVELLQTGAVLHDFGKIDELSYERGFGYTTEGQLLGHLTMETLMVSDQIRQISGFPEELRRHLLHLLITHHGKLEHGSPKLPMTPEALMLAYLDDLDSKVEAMQRLMADPHAIGDWTRISPMFERPVYRGHTLKKDETGASGAALPATAAETSSENATSIPPNRSASSAGGSFNTPFQGLGRLIKE